MEDENINVEADSASEYFPPLGIYRKIKHLCYNSKIPKENYVS